MNLEKPRETRIVYSGDASFDPLETSADKLLLTISAAELQKGAVGGSVATLCAMSDGSRVFAMWAGRLRVCCEGESDGRKPWEVEEVRSYFKAMTAQWPFWWHYCTRDDQGIGLVTTLLCTEEVRVSGSLGIDPVRFASVQAQLAHANRQLYKSMGAPPGSAERLEAQVRQIALRTIGQ